MLLKVVDRTTGAKLVDMQRIREVTTVDITDMTVELRKALRTVAILDTDDMTVELVSSNDLWYLRKDGIVDIANMVSVEWGTIGYALAIPRNTYIYLGCGDIWYNDLVWNKATGCMFEMPNVVEIRVYDNYYSLMVDTGTLFSSLKEHFFYYDEKDIVDEVRGTPISRGGFLKRAVLGV